jgi:protein-L-isoaspartate(D-aspartate) O-methyltransferase
MVELVENLKKSRVLRSPQIVEAFLKVRRKDFVPENMRDYAHLDEALPIGYGQTISQPYTVAFMFELLEPKRGEKIMDVGHGSGWTTALLANIVGRDGRVYAFERIEELCNFGEENLLKYPELRKNILLFCHDASYGLPLEKLDAIIAAAELSEVPELWREQLKLGGRLVYPKEGAVFKEVKKGENDFSVQKHPGFVFVPFVKNGGRS